MRYRFVLAVLVLAAIIPLAAQRSGGTQSACDYFASTTGSDTNPGTQDLPFRTVQRLENALGPGQVGCLRQGTFAEEQVVFDFAGNSEADRITIMSYPGERATIYGMVKVVYTARYITFRDLVLDGTGGPVIYEAAEDEYRTQASPMVHGDYTEWIGVDITKRNREVERRYTGVCMQLGASGYGYVAEGTRIIGSKIHNCGPMADQPGGPDNHGIYVNLAVDTVIRGNHIYENGERGIQLYPNADNTLIERNLIERNGQGILFSGSDSEVSSGNIVRNNAVYSSLAGANIYSNYNQTSLVGENNQVYNNCLWNSPTDMGLGSAVGFTAFDNVHARPENCPLLC